MNTRYRYLILSLVSFTVGCGRGNEPIGVTAQAQLVDNQLADIDLAIPVPYGYGNYCSITNSQGAWWLYAAQAGEDACWWAQALFGADGTIQRAGLWATTGDNNVMVQCDGTLYLYRGSGRAPIDQAQAQVNVDHSNCVFTIAPVVLPIFTTPIDSFVYSDPPSVPNFDRGYPIAGYYYQLPWDPRSFGQGWGVDTWQSKYCPTIGGIPGDPPNTPCNTNADCGGFFASACQHVVPWDQKHCVTPRCSGVAFDRTGTERGYLTGKNGGNTQEPGAPNVMEDAYDWNQPDGTPLLAMADGVVAFSGCRDYLNQGPYPDTASARQIANCQEELYIEHEVGTGRYAEHFIAVYHHMDWYYPLATTGTQVHRGDVVGYVGTSGASGSYHLDLSVFRTTNLSGGRGYKFVAEPTLYGACTQSSDCNVNGATTYRCFNPMSSSACKTSSCNCVSWFGLNGNPGVIDPYGWNAPSGIDPAAWMFLGQNDWTLPAGITSDGAFSIDLMDPYSNPRPNLALPLPPTVGFPLY
jgi:murein DD-endopeptidase MepM/ murein hydrolase activator NlpD